MDYTTPASAARAGAPSCSARRHRRAVRRVRGQIAGSLGHVGRLHHWVARSPNRRATRRAITGRTRSRRLCDGSTGLKVVSTSADALLRADPATPMVDDQRTAGLGARQANETVHRWNADRDRSPSPSTTLRGRRYRFFVDPVPEAERRCTVPASRSNLRTDGDGEWLCAPRRRRIVTGARRRRRCARRLPTSCCSTGGSTRVGRVFGDAAASSDGRP
jgi:hypothetical protein